MAPAPSKLAVELDVICRVYRRPILSGRGVCTLSPYNQFLVDEARRRQPAYFKLTKTLEKQNFALDLVHWAEAQGWEFVVRYNDGRFGLMADDAKREKVQRLLGERPRVKNVVAVPPPPFNNDVDGEGVLPPPMNVAAIRGDDFDGDDDDDDDVASVASGNDNSEALLSHHSAVNTHPTQPEVDSQRRAPSDTFTASSNTTWNDIGSLSTLSSEPRVVLPPFDDGGEDIDVEAEVETVALPLLMDDEGSLMEMETIGPFSAESGWIPLDPMEIVQLWGAIAATSPVGMIVSIDDH